MFSMYCVLFLGEFKDVIPVARSDGCLFGGSCEFVGSDYESNLVLSKRREHDVFQAVDISKFSAFVEDLFA